MFVLGPIHSVTFLMLLQWLLCVSTLRRWRGGQQVESWDAHKAAIQAVVKLPSGELVTGISLTFCSLLHYLSSVLNDYFGHFLP